MNIYEVLASKPHSDFHLRRYCAFISARINRTLIQYTERHHICPKAKDLFPEYKSLVKNPWNAIDLTPREHFIAHLMLMNVYGGSQLKAFILMGGRTGNNQSRIYEKAKAAQSAEMTTNNQNADGSLSKKAWATASDERREKQREIARKVGAAKRKPKGTVSATCVTCGCVFSKENWFLHQPLRPNCSTACGRTSGVKNRQPKPPKPKKPRVRSMTDSQISEMRADNGRKSAAKQSATVIGRIRLYRPDGSWTWQYPNKQ